MKIISEEVNVALNKFYHLIRTDMDGFVYGELEGIKDIWKGNDQLATEMLDELTNRLWSEDERTRNKAGCAIYRMAEYDNDLLAKILVKLGSLLKIENERVLDVVKFTIKNIIMDKGCFEKIPHSLELLV